MAESWKCGLHEMSSLFSSASTSHHSHALFTTTILLKQLCSSNVVIMKEDHIQVGLQLLAVIVFLKVNPFNGDFQIRRNV